MLCDLVDHTYTIGIPKQDDFLLILLMNAMSSELSPLHNHVADCINASTTTNPYTSTHIVWHIEMEQQPIDGEKQRQTSLALAATIHCPSNTKTQSTKTCSNCGGTGHMDDECWKEVGGCAGQCDAILAEKQAARVARGGKDKPSIAKPTTKVPTGTQATHGLHYDTPGHAYSSSKKCPNVCIFFTKVNNP